MAGDFHIDEGSIREMLVNPAFIAAFPFLKTLTITTKAGCGRCGRKATTSPDFNAIKRAFASMPPDQRERLKQMLKIAGNAVVRWSVGPDKIQKVIF